MRKFKIVKYIVIGLVIIFLVTSFSSLISHASNTDLENYQKKIESSSPSEQNIVNNPLRIMHNLVDLTIKNGVPINTVLLLLLLPLIALIITFIRQVIGIKTLGIYIPSILTIVFLETKLIYGLLLFLTIFLMGMFFRFILKKIRLLYIPKIAILLTLVSLSILLFLAIASRLGLSQIAVISVLAIFVMIVLLEEFIDVEVKKGTKESLQLVLGTLLVSILSYFITSWGSLQVFFLNYPEIILLIVILDYALGKWSGLRLTEYYRFRRGLDNVSDTQK